MRCATCSPSARGTHPAPCNPRPSRHVNSEMPPNEPQWGKKNNEGPPDLDEILRKLQQKISGVLGIRRPSGPPGGGMGNAVGGGVAFVILLIVAVWLASGFYIVDEGRRGVVLRLGKYIET